VRTGRDSDREQAEHRRPPHQSCRRGDVDAMNGAETLPVERLTDPQLVTREALLSMITAQTESLIPDVTGGPRAHEVALTVVQLAAAYAAILGSENQ
jgi:hypothetical protein